MCLQVTRQRCSALQVFFNNSHLCKNKHPMVEKIGVDEAAELQTLHAQITIWCVIKKLGTWMDKQVTYFSNLNTDDFFIQITICSILVNILLQSFKFSVVRRGCIDRNAKINGRTSDGEGCEEILRDSKETYFQQIICMCPSDLCNNAINLINNSLSPGESILYSAFLMMLFRL